MSEAATSNRPLPRVTDRATWQARIDELRGKEKAHTRVGDALAAERRRLPMVELDPTTALIGADGPVPLIDVVDGRSQLIAYFHMWHIGRPAAQQCEGCTFNTSHINELSYLHSRDVTYATFCEGPYEEASRYRDFMGYTVPWYSVPLESVGPLVADRHFGILVCYLRDGDEIYETYWTTGRGDEVMAPSYGLLDLTVYGRQEFWEDSPEGYPQTAPYQWWRRHDEYGPSFRPAEPDEATELEELQERSASHWDYPDGYFDWAGDARDIHASYVRDNPVHVLVDGAVVGQTPWEGPVAPGRHTIVLRGAGTEGSQPMVTSVRANQTTPVGLYPRGATLEKVQDMAGEVWGVVLFHIFQPPRTRLGSYVVFFF